MKKRFPVPLATMLVIGLAVSGCGDPPNSNGDAAENRSVDLIESTPAATGEIEELDWALFEEPNSFDPSRANGGDSDAVIANVCEGLFRTEPDLSVKPWLAESVDQPDDHTFVLTIRSGVKFHTGEELSAEDVVWNLERNASPDSGEADEFANVESIDQTGDRQVTLTLAENDPQLEYRLAGGAGIIVDPQAVEDQGQDYGTAGSDDGCTGPFSIGEWDAGSKITIERFEDYWDSKGRSLSKP